MKTNLTENQKSRIRNLDAITASAALIGNISGLMYANKTGGGFWRYVGYTILGGAIFGLPAMLVITPFKNKILKEGDHTNNKGEEEKSEFIAKKTTKIQSNDGYYCYNPKTNSGYFSLKPCEEGFVDITADM